MLERIKSFFLTGQSGSSDIESETESAYLPREKLLVFGGSVILAFCLWFIVNLSRDFSITFTLPLEVVDMAEDMALVEEPPEDVSVGISGEGWTLISLYSNPPLVRVNVEGSEINLHEVVQQQLSSISDITITQVEPTRLNLRMEEKMSREVYVEPRVEIRSRDRFGLIGEPVWEPGTVTVTGAASRVEQVDTVFTVATVLEDVNESREVELALEQPTTGLRLSPDHIDYRFQMAEFTEGEVRVPIRIRNLPPDRSVSYYPSSVTVRFEVPIDQYNDVRNARPFNAYVDYSTIEADTTGLVAPEVERSDDPYEVRLRSVQPRTVSYFTVID